MGAASHLGLDVVLADNLAPVSHLLGKEYAEVLGIGEYERHLLAITQSIRDSRLAQDFAHNLAHIGDDIGRRAIWRKNSPPGERLEIGEARFDRGLRILE